jgi:hypothetical protein
MTNLASFELGKAWSQLVPKIYFVTEQLASFVNNMKKGQFMVKRGGTKSK